MKKVNGYFVPEAGEIKKAIKEARSYSLSTGNRVQAWFDCIDGEFHKEEFVDENSTVILPDYCYEIGMVYGDEEETARSIEEIARNIK